MAGEPAQYHYERHWERMWEVSGRHNTFLSAGRYSPQLFLKASLSVSVFIKTRIRWKTQNLILWKFSEEFTFDFAKASISWIATKFKRGQ